MQYLCRVCGYVAKEKGEKHPCGSIKVLVHEADNPPPALSKLDGMMRKIIGSVDTHLKDYVNTGGEEVDKIHPRMLITIIASNIIMNLFLNIYDNKAPTSDILKGFDELMRELNTMAKQGIQSFIAATADTDQPH